MKRRPCTDPRLYPWPKTFENGSEVYLRARVLTPHGFNKAKSLILEPASFIWRMGMILFIFDLILSWAEVWSVFLFVSFGRNEAYAVMGALYLLWLTELSSGYPTVRLLFGETIRIGVGCNKLTIGGIFKKTSWRLDHPITFGLRKFELTEDLAYKHSQQLNLIYDEARCVPVIDVLGPVFAENLVANANMLLHLGGHGSMSELDTDPTRS